MLGKRRVKHSTKPEQFKQQILAMATAGMSQRKISRTTGAHRSTVRNILNEPEAQAQLEQTKRELLMLTRDALNLWRKRILQGNVKGDVKLASRVLVSTGVVPPAVEEVSPPGINPYQLAKLMGVNLKVQTGAQAEHTKTYQNPQT